MQERYGLEISCTTVQSILRTGGVMLEPLYNTIHSKIVTEKILGIDETTLLIDGKIGWMWVARSKSEGPLHFRIQQRWQNPKETFEEILRDFNI